MIMFDGEEYFTCVCGDFDHTLRFVLDLDRDSEYQFPTIYVECQLNEYMPWYKRILIAIKYIFKKTQYYHSGCWEINANSDDPDRMIEMLNKLKKEMETIKIKKNS